MQEGAVAVVVPGQGGKRAGAGIAHYLQSAKSWDFVNNALGKLMILMKVCAIDILNLHEEVANAVVDRYGQHLDVRQIASVVF